MVINVRLCKNCAFWVDDESMFCQRCGHQLSPPPAQHVTETSVSQPPQYPYYNVPCPPPYPHPYEDKEHNAKISLTCGILSLVTFFSIIGGLVFGIIAIVQARIAQRMRYSPAGGMANGGMATGITGIYLAVFFGFALLIFVAN